MPRSKMNDKFKYSNAMMMPCLDKIVINMGVGEAVADSKKIKKRIPYLRGEDKESHFQRCW